MNQIRVFILLCLPILMAMGGVPPDPKPSPIRVNCPEGFDEENRQEIYRTGDSPADAEFSYEHTRERREGCRNAAPSGCISTMVTSEPNCFLRRPRALGGRVPRTNPWACEGERVCCSRPDPVFSPPPGADPIDPIWVPIPTPTP